jgi:ABC-2 type transport system permease protein
MKQIIHIALKDIKIEFSEKSTLIFFLLLPLVFTTIIGLGLKNSYGSEESEDPRLVIVVVNQDDDRYGEQLLEFMEQSDTSRPVLRSKGEAETLMKNESISSYVEIPADFSQKILEGEKVQIEFTKYAESTTAVGLEQDLLSSIGKLNTVISIRAQGLETLNKQPELTKTDQEDFLLEMEKITIDRLINPPTKAISTQSELVQNQIPTGFEQSSPGQLVTWVLTTLLGGSEAFVYERNKGTLRRLLITPNRKGIIFTGKILGRLIMGIVQMILLIGFGALVLNVNWGKDYLALAIMLFCFGLAGTALGIMLASFARTVRQASGLTILFSMVLAALGGAWWPLEITPKVYQTAVQVLPSTWAMRGFNDVIIRGQNVQGIIVEAGVLLGFALLFFIVGIWRLKFE